MIAVFDVGYGDFGTREGVFDFLSRFGQDVEVFHALEQVHRAG